MLGNKWLQFATICVSLACQWNGVHGQCSGTSLLLVANSTFQFFTSPNYPLHYPNNQNCTWIIQTENVTDALRLEILDTAMEYHADCAFDTAEVFDGQNSNAASLTKFCGVSMPTVVSSGNFLTVVFTSDYSLSSRGFKGQYKSGLRSDLLDDEEETQTYNFVVIGAVAVGVIILLFTIGGVVYCFHEVKLAKRSQQVTALEPQDALPAYQHDYVPPPGPPAYGDYCMSPMSPPPLYSHLYPNPRSDLHSATSIHTRNNMQRTSNTRERACWDTNANTHYVPPAIGRGVANNPSPDAGYQLPRNTCSSAAPGNVFASSLATSDIPGHVADAHVPEDTTELQNDTTAPCTASSNNNTDTNIIGTDTNITATDTNITATDTNITAPDTRENAHADNNAASSGNVQSIEGMGGTTTSTEHGPVGESSIDRRVSNVSDMALSLSVCSGEESIFDETDFYD